jgi:hypothetical protein
MIPPVNPAPLGQFLGGFRKESFVSRYNGSTSRGRMDAKTICNRLN